MDLSRHVKWLKPPVFLLCLGPFLTLAWKVYHDTYFPDAPPELLGNPQEFIRNSLGFWTLTFLCVTLAVTPARRLLHLNWLIRFRRMIGLFALFYATVHFVTYVLFDTGLDFSMVVADVYKRPFITMGVLSFVLMILLGLTSTAGMVRRLGGKRWQLLHRLIYISAIAGVIHYYWIVKSDITVPVRFAAIVAVLLLYRVVHYVLASRAKQKQPAKQSALSA